MKAMDKGFYLGVITALHIMDMHGDEVQFDELVNVCDLEDLVKVAVEQGELEFSGLAKRKYAQQSVKRTAGMCPHLSAEFDYICVLCGKLVPASRR